MCHTSHLRKRGSWQPARAWALVSPPGPASLSSPHHDFLLSLPAQSVPPHEEPTLGHGGTWKRVCLGPALPSLRQEPSTRAHVRARCKACGVAGRHVSDVFLQGRLKRASRHVKPTLTTTSATFSFLVRTFTAEEKGNALRGEHTGQLLEKPPFPAIGTRSPASSCDPRSPGCGGPS